MKNILSPLFILLTLSLNAQNPGDIIITEVMQNPMLVTDDMGEWFEIYNATTESIDLNGWMLTDLGSNEHLISESVLIEAGQYAVIGNNSDMSTNGGLSIVYSFGNDYNLANGDDEIILSFNGTIIDEVSYDGGPLFPDLNGISMALNPQFLTAQANDQGENWCPSTEPYGDGDLGTPGSENSACSTHTSDLIEISDISIYPNPCSTNLLNIKSKGTDFPLVTIYTFEGQQLLQTKLKTTTVDISFIEAGSYLLNLQFGSNNYSQKLVLLK